MGNALRCFAKHKAALAPDNSSALVITPLHKKD